jgi:hypothetical protein
MHTPRKIDDQTIQDADVVLSKLLTHFVCCWRRIVLLLVIVFIGMSLSDEPWDLTILTSYSTWDTNDWLKRGVRISASSQTETGENHSTTRSRKQHHIITETERSNRHWRWWQMFAIRTIDIAPHIKPLSVTWTPESNKERGIVILKC